MEFVRGFVLFGKLLFILCGLLAPVILADASKYRQREARKQKAVKIDTSGYNPNRDGKFVSSYHADLCLDGSKYPYPGMPHMYLWCNFGEFILMECPAGTEFCPQFGVCCYHNMAKLNPRRMRAPRLRNRKSKFNKGRVRLLQDKQNSEDEKHEPEDDLPEPDRSSETTDDLEESNNNDRDDGEQTLKDFPVNDQPPELEEPQPRDVEPSNTEPPEPHSTKQEAPFDREPQLLRDIRRPPPPRSAETPFRRKPADELRTRPRPQSTKRKLVPTTPPILALVKSVAQRSREQEPIQESPDREEHFPPHSRSDTYREHEFDHASNLPEDIPDELHPFDQRDILDQTQANGEQETTDKRTFSERELDGFDEELTNFKLTENNFNENEHFANENAVTEQTSNEENTSEYSHETTDDLRNSKSVKSDSEAFDTNDAILDAFDDNFPDIAPREPTIRDEFVDVFSEEVSNRDDPYRRDGLKFQSLEIENSPKLRYEVNRPDYHSKQDDSHQERDDNHIPKSTAATGTDQSIFSKRTTNQQGIYWKDGDSPKERTPSDAPSRNYQTQGFPQPEPTPVNEPTTSNNGEESTTAEELQAFLSNRRRLMRGSFGFSADDDDIKGRDLQKPVSTGAAAADFSGNVNSIQAAIEKSRKEKSIWPNQASPESRKDREVTSSTESMAENTESFRDLGSSYAHHEETIRQLQEVIPEIISAPEHYRQSDLRSSYPEPSFNNVKVSRPPNNAPATNLQTIVLPLPTSGGGVKATRQRQEDDLDSKPRGPRAIVAEDGSIKIVLRRDILAQIDELRGGGLVGAKSGPGDPVKRRNNLKRTLNISIVFE